MADAFLCLVLDVFGPASIESARPLGWIPLPWASFQRPEHNAFDFDSRFLVALPPAQDLLLCAKHLFVAALVVAIAPAEGSKDEQWELFSPEF